MTSPARRAAVVLCAALAGTSAHAEAAPELTVEGESRPAGSFTRVLPDGGRAAVSIDLALSPGAAATLGDESPLRLRRSGRRLIVTSAGVSRRLPGRKVHHVEAAVQGDDLIAIDGVPIDSELRRGRSFTLQVQRGRVVVQSFIASPLDEAPTLLLHRLAALHAVTPAGRAPLGVGADGRLRFHAGWTRGFWPGSLWQAADLVPREAPFSAWALQATLRNFGAEREDTHDLGFMYARSSVAAYERLCRTAKREPPGDERTCARLRRSALTAADSLAALGRTNPVAGMIPTRAATLCRGCASLEEADTIIDSMMNLSLLLWAARETPAERAGYRDMALTHARAVARHLVRADGSTAQSVHNRRSDGAILGTHTHQGAADTSTWARGPSWAVYGFAQTALLTRSPGLLDVAERIAGFIAARNPSGQVPPYDYDAPAGAPTDVSAGVIGAAGLFLLEDACRRLERCDRGGRRWRELGTRMLESSLDGVGQAPPLGLLDGQVFSLGGSQTWDDSGEFIFGLDYALEAVRRESDRSIPVWR